MKLFEPGRIGMLTVKNRIVMAPMSLMGHAEPDGRFSQRAIDHYVARAKGGVGLIITGMCIVEPEIEPVLEQGTFSHFPRVDARVYIPRLGELVNAVHDYGAKIAVQLAAALGRVAPPFMLRQGRLIAPSALPCFWNPSVTARELTTEEVERLVSAFQPAARVVRRAGFDAIEIHAHQGYLEDEFMTALWNRRTDKYGGDLEGRLRFPLEIIENVRKVVGRDFPIIYRYAGKHYLKGGREVEESLEIAKRLEEAGVDALHVDAGCYEQSHWAVPSMYQQPGCLVELAEAVKRVVKIPVITVGKLGYPELAETVLEEEKADFIALGRALLADSEWSNKVKEGRWEDIRPCIGDGEGCLARLLTGQYTSCAVDPTVGMERELALSPAEKKKSVLVVGGGPAGMEAARVAALRGHQVTLWEKGNALGGNLLPGSVPEFKQDIKSLVEYLCTQIKKLGVNIELGKEATAELIQKVKPQVLIFATGATSLIPDIPGIGKDKVVTAVDLLLGKKEAKGDVVVAGGGLAGCETAVHIAQKGKRVTIVEMTERIARDIRSDNNRDRLLEMLAENKVEVLTNTYVTEIADEGVIITDKNGMRKVLKADTVVLALGLKPETQLWEALNNKLAEVYAIGDCVEPRKIMDAICEGYRTARLV